MLYIGIRTHFNHLLCVVTAHSALCILRNKLPYTLLKPPKTPCCLGGCSLVNALNLQKWGVRIHNHAPFYQTSLPFFIFGYTECIPFLFRINLEAITLSLSDWKEASSLHILAQHHLENNHNHDFLGTLLWHFVCFFFQFCRWNKNVLQEFLFLTVL